MASPYEYLPDPANPDVTTVTMDSSVDGLRRSYANICTYDNPGTRPEWQRSCDTRFIKPSAELNPDGTRDVVPVYCSFQAKGCPAMPGPDGEAPTLRILQSAEAVRREAASRAEIARLAIDAAQGSGRQSSRRPGMERPTVNPDYL